ncbi:MAG TPA: flagellar hook-basal body complex protein FliE [Gemmatimonadaceae bacterium]|nr:flagellar hook-basal body complex protein FliE [Gemmatimonadaceae bacterium]
MTAPIGGMGGFGGPSSFGGPTGPRKLGLDIAGENSIAGSGQSRPGGGSFGDTLTRALNQVSATQDVAQNYIQQFVQGQPVELHQVMAASEEASISLEMLVELRNKVMDAYKTVMQMG